MPILLLLAFITVPVIEIALFLEIGGWIGLWPTILIVIITACAGTTLLRIQGVAVLKRAQRSASRNELPVQEVFDGVCLLVAGALLLTPGFFTDVCGFMLFVPLFRKLVGIGIWRWLSRNGETHVGGFGPASSPRPSDRDGAGPPGGRVIDGDFEEVTASPSAQDRLPSKDEE
ncbi:MAG: hypothetical protein CFH41_01085 [Alphaproteobacteria bacterium MarineAlpha11_Bin1]|nr:MAG: hypothetical protein CFH41_01085 [Alphaproteobacteria bacterium MarineAlpha11_Bin1]|tara:strand:- start:4071 stop:4589 length:519 start_codon:yes stop_codon:yes gene_type:complete